MNTEQFLQLLQQAGFPAPVEVQQPANGGVGLHAHPFAVKALVIKGQIQIVLNGIATDYSPGEIFQLDFEQAHTESYGPQGVSYLASRKSA